ncbi:spermidine/putrescine ABC transporter ATP-binding protein [Domibacillus mangrovi]|uniref:Spermidine/putrescine ABC transporter ATP-binding protein n=1 Tax=Domibacillus mangrovi TaxID=1714354 RepID=A0A1Q5P441_9BACI|nr:spermidine/putrescine ABC transporter ATP-binding protein [Domibacillus mangrovi]
MHLRLFYPALTGSKTSLQAVEKKRRISGGSTARKSPIGSTNIQ